MEKFYTYNKASKTLTPLKTPVQLPSGQMRVAPSAPEAALFDAFPLRDTTPPTPPEGKVAVINGFALDETDSAWVAQYRFEDVPAPEPEPAPTIEECDAAMEEHLRLERCARGYTTREPDAYLTSSNPRWKKDAEDWVAHRDAVMTYAIALMNAVEAGTREPPTLDEFKAGLPSIVWTYAD